MKNISLKAHLALEALFYIIFLALASQQSMVLFSVSLVQENPFCYTFFLPPGTSVRKAVCYYAWATAGIPVGVPMGIGGVLLGLAAAKVADGGGDEPVVMVVVAILGIAALMLFCCGVGLFGFWLVFGVGWGFWVHFTAFFQQRIFLIAELLAPSGFLFDTIFDGLHKVQ